MERIQRDVTARPARCGLDLHFDKTRLVDLGQFAAMDRSRRAIGHALKGHMLEDGRETGLRLGQVPNGWRNHCAKPTGHPHLRRFGHNPQRLWLRAPLPRSQRNSFAWARL